MQDLATTESAAKRFFERVRVRCEVWGLRDQKGGWARSPSHNVEGASVILFWSDRAYAARCATGDWAQLVPAMIALRVFTDVWLPGMARDSVLVGPNWDAQLHGLELPAPVASSWLCQNDA
jgi:hypothetical protein